MTKPVTKQGAYADLEGDIRVERVYARRKLGCVLAWDTAGTFIVSAERVSNFEDPSVLAGNVPMPKGWPWNKGFTISMVVVDDAKRYLALRVLDRVLSELENAA